MPNDDMMFENMKQALALLTAWNESAGDDDHQLVQEMFASYVSGAASLEAVTQRMESLLSGLLSLSGRLLISLSTATGKTTAELLEIFGRRIAEGR